MMPSELMLQSYFVIHPEPVEDIEMENSVDEEDED